MIKFMNVSILIVLTLNVTDTTPVKNKESNDWWKRATFYQIYPRSFKDSNNDGVGDLQGIISKLEHLRDVGVTAAWLSPIYSSPQVDQGYDISNFTDIHYEYGTMDDFKQLIAKANELGVKIIMDFVPNHSSDKHQWFVKSENKEPGYEDYYVWKDGKDGGPPNNWISIFKYSAWEYSEKRQQYYLHQFAVQQPDLNYNDPKLVQEMKDVMTFWLDLGVAGFRIDAVPHLFEDTQNRDEPLSHNPDVTPDDYDYLNHIYTKDLPKTFDMIYQWRKHVDDYSANHKGDARIIMTEAYTTIENTMLYYGDANHEGAHFTFNFFLITNVNAESTAQDIVDTINLWTSNLPKGKISNWVLGNHDNHRVATRLGKNRVDGLNMLISLLPGVAVTYNGEEIGMEDGLVTWEEGKDPSACNGKPEDFNKTSRDFERTPFQWDDSVNAGFNEGAETWLPVSENYKTVNVAAQNKPNLNSHYNIYKKLRQLRKSDILINGDYEIVVATTNTLALLRNLNGKSLVLVFNLSDNDDAVDLTKVLSVPSELIAEVVSVQSEKKVGDKLQASDIKLKPDEALILTTL